MSDFEAQCDCEIDSPGVMSEQPIELRLECWTNWALYLKKRIETHYRPRIAELEAALSKCEELCKSHKLHAADCKRLVTACENDIDELRFKLAQAEAEADRQEELIEALDPHGLRRKKLGLGGTP